MGLVYRGRFEKYEINPLEVRPSPRTPRSGIPNPPTEFGEVGSDTFGHILAAYPDAKFDNLTKLGLRAIEKTSFYDAATKQDVNGVYGKAQELSNGKDTTTGHWAEALCWVLRIRSEQVR